MSISATELYYCGMGLQSREILKYFNVGRSGALCILGAGFIQHHQGLLFLACGFGFYRVGHVCFLEEIPDCVA